MIYFVMREACIKILIYFLVFVLLFLDVTFQKRVYGQFCIETLHESRKWKSSGLFV